MSKDAIKKRQRNQEYREQLTEKAAQDERAARLLAKRERDAQAKRDKRAAAKTARAVMTMTNEIVADTLQDAI